MPPLRPPSPTVKVVSCFAALACIYTAIVLWTFTQSSQSISLSVAAGQKLSPFTNQFVALGAAALLTALCALWLRRTVTAPLGEAILAARAMARADLRSGNINTNDLQNSELLSTMQEMNTFLSEIIANVRNTHDGVAGEACDAARTSTSLALRLADQSMALGSATAVMQQMRASAHLQAERTHAIHLQLRDVQRAVATAPVPIGSAGDAAPWARELAPVLSRLAVLVADLVRGSAAQRGAADHLLSMLASLAGAARQHDGLAQESASAASALRDQAGALARLLATFTLDPGQAGVPLIHLAHHNLAQRAPHMAAPRRSTALAPVPRSRSCAVDR